MSLYDDLGVTPDATTETIKQAHRKRVRKTHPDAGGDRAEFERVQHAYLVLINPERRDRYDRTGEEAPAIDRSAQRACGVLTAMVDQFLAQVSIEQLGLFDLRTSLDQQFARIFADMKKEEAEIRKAIKKAEKALARLIHKGDQPDVLRGMFLAKIEGEKKRIEQIEQARADHQLAEEYGKAYDWEQDQQVMPFFGNGTGGGSTTATFTYR